MKYSIVCSSKTGNTLRLAEEIQHVLNQEVTIYDQPREEAKKADLIFVGFWTDKGSCTEDIKEFLQSLEHKKIFLFGTAGFGGGEEYFEQILGRVKLNISDTNQVIGEYMCQGKMPMGVRTRYEGMLAKDPTNENMKNMIQNFDHALQHPSEEDLGELRDRLKRCV